MRSQRELARELALKYKRINYLKIIICYIYIYIKQILNVLTF